MQREYLVSKNGVENIEDMAISNTNENLEDMVEYERQSMTKIKKILVFKDN